MSTLAPLRVAAILHWFVAVGFGVFCFPAIRNLLIGRPIPIKSQNECIHLIHENANAELCHPPNFSTTPGRMCYVAYSAYPHCW